MYISIFKTIDIEFSSYSSTKIEKQTDRQFMNGKNFEIFKWHETIALLKADKHIWDRELRTSLLGIIDSLIVNFLQLIFHNAL